MYIYLKTYFTRSETNTIVIFLLLIVMSAPVYNPNTRPHVYTCRSVGNNI